MNLSDINTIESDECSEEQYFESIQRAINSGSAWSFQGSYGRSMMQAIEDGQCLLGNTGARDYYGNYIPSRAQVKSGTKGSIEFVAEAMGQEYADRMAFI